MTTAEVLGMKAWEVYYRELSCRYGAAAGRQRAGANCFDNRHWKTFQKIGSICEAQSLDVESFIKTSFDLLKVEIGYITPADFTRDETVRLYRDTLSKLGPSGPVADWAMQERYLLNLAARTIPERYDNLAMILVDVDLPFTGWFRICYLPTVLGPLFDLYGRVAHDEMRQDATLRRHLRQLRPAHVNRVEQQYGFFGDIDDATHSTAV